MKVTNKSTVRVGAAGVAVIGIIVLFLVMFAVERIDSGQTASSSIWPVVSVE